jgi:hypothetical protein
MHRTVRALLSAAAAAVSATTFLVGISPAPAQAQTYGDVPLTSWTYTDKAQPATPNPNPAGDFLIGTREGSTGRAYFTFDLTPLKGQVLHRVTFFSTESTVTDCSKVVTMQVWRTKPVTSTTTWQKSPKELELLGERTRGPDTFCPQSYLGIDMIPAIQAAFARGEKKISIGVRVSAAGEDDASLGRTMRQARMSYAANHAPKVSGLKLRYPDAGCGTLDEHPTAGRSVQVQATVTDADPGDNPQITYAYWPVDRPAERKETGWPALDISGLADGTVVAWTAQGWDYDDAGPWGKTCYFTVDTVAPAMTPVVSSKEYPTAEYPGGGGPGVPGTFVFDAAGDVETVGFDWSPLDGGTVKSVKANHPGGRAKVTITPRTRGAARLEVAARDAAGNRGPWIEYRYEVRDSAPLASVEVNGVGLTSHISLSSKWPEVTSFGYTVDDGPETRVPAVDGKGAADLVFDSPGTKTMVLRAYAGNRMIGTDTIRVGVTDAPRVTSTEFDGSSSAIEGRPGSFTFAPRRAGVVSYLYDFGDGAQRSIDAGADGTAVLNWTPDRGGSFGITVYSVDASGTRSLAAQKSFYVRGLRPEVIVRTVDAHVGEPVSVIAVSDLPTTVAIVHSFDGGPQKTIDGSYVNFSVVPTRAGDSLLKVWAKQADGTLSPPAEQVIHVDSAPGVVSKGPFDEHAVMGSPVSFTFTAVQEGATTFRYSVGSEYDGQDHPQLTVPVGPDGTATVSHDVPFQEWGDVQVKVVSLTADGTESDVGIHSIYARDPRVEVFTNPWPADAPEAMGGVGIPGQFGFVYYDLGEVTTKYWWRVNDGPEQEAVFDPWAWETVVSYTPDRVGDNVLYVSREFTDGSRSPVTTVPFKVGNEVARS